VNGIFALICCALACAQAGAAMVDTPAATAPTTTAFTSAPTALTAAAPAAIAKPNVRVTAAPLAQFKWFEYSGHDSVFDRPLAAGTFRNPILAGFYPDPSITRAGKTFYLVNSTFTYFPGIPVFYSYDLVHWHAIGNVIDRSGQLNFAGLSVSRGVFAPTIRFHNGTFYVISTAVDAGGNFLSVATEPQGPWSDPIWLPQVEGIDPSLFFDDDGKVYVLNNGPPAGPAKYAGHRAIWIQEFDLGARKLVGPRKVLVNGGVDFSKKPVWIEGPHMYRHDGWYLLMCAEGGTSTQHSEVVLRARSPWGPFKPFAGNPILTQRDLPAQRANPLTNAGHADLVEAVDGTWWAVFLASRPYDGVHYNTGRETFLLPVTWRDGWPLILPKGKEIPYAPAGREEAEVSIGSLGSATAAHGAKDPATTGNFRWRDEFDSPVLSKQWLFVRVPKLPWADLTRRPGWLTINALRVPLDSLQNMSFLARRQQHLSFDASTELEIPAAPGVSAGIAAFQNENYWYFLGVRRRPVGGGGPPPASRLELFLEKRAGSKTETVAAAPLDEGAARGSAAGQGVAHDDAPNQAAAIAGAASIKLAIVGNGSDYSFYFDPDGSGWKPLMEHADGTILSTDVAGGFVGAMVGPYARAD
jgi:xylan 1,4-beta-xylosidase